MVPKGQRRKLDPKAKKLIMVGYSTQHKDGYRLYDPETRQIVIRRDVVFNEAEKGHTSLLASGEQSVTHSLPLPELIFPIVTEEDIQAPSSSDDDDDGDEDDANEGTELEADGAGNEERHLAERGPETTTTTALDNVLGG